MRDVVIQANTVFVKISKLFSHKYVQPGVHSNEFRHFLRHEVRQNLGGPTQILTFLFDF